MASGASQNLNREAGEKPKLIPLVAADSGYSENSSVNILCTVSQGHHESLTFDWFKDGRLLAADGSPSGASGDGGADELGDGELATSLLAGEPTATSGAAGRQEEKIDDVFVDHLNSGSGNNNNNGNRNHHHHPVKPKIEKHSDHSLLRIARVHFSHSGRYTCSAKNNFGSDSSSVNLIVNGKLV